MKYTPISPITFFVCITFTLCANAQVEQEVLRLKNNYHTLKNLLSTDSTNVDLLLEAAKSARKLIFIRSNQVLVGIAFLGKAILLDNRNSNYFLNLGVCKARSKKLKEGCTDWKQAHELGASDAAGLIRKYCLVTCAEPFTDCGG